MTQYDDDLIIVYRNYKRYEHLNLAIQTAKHFVPENKIYCVDFYDNEYDFENLNKIKLSKNNIIIEQSKYYFDKTNRSLCVRYKIDQDWIKRKHYEKTSDHIEPYDHTYCDLNDLPNSINTLFFSEGYNVVYDNFKNYDGKILCINEDQFFTTGKTIEDLKQNDFDLAWANWNWPTEYTVNGSILCFVPNRCNSLFPLPELPVFVDSCYYEFIVTRQPKHKLNLYKMKYRNGENYFGDGIRTNSYNDMLNHLVTFFPNLIN